MGKESITSALVIAVMAAVIVLGNACAAIPESGNAPVNQGRAAWSGLKPRASLLYPESTGFLRQDSAGGAGRFWLPDSMESGWRARDKKLHFFASYSIVLTGEAVTDRLGTGSAWAVGLSIAKELWDLWFKTPASQRGVSRGDLVADAVGLAAAVLVVEASND